MLRSVMMNKTKLAVLGGLATVAFGALPGCIAGPPPCSADGASSTASSSDSSSSTSAANDVTKIAIPPGVVPTGVGITDPSTAAVTNIDPPGSWFMMNDHSPKGTMTPETNADFPSVTADGLVHTTGKMYTDWGGGVGFNFVGEQMKPVDASSFKGIRFKASGSTPMHLGLATAVTMPDFGICTKCYDHYSVDINNLTSTPKTYEFTWDKLHQSGFGSPKAKLDTKTIIGLNLTSKGATPWDFSIGDLEWIK
jgi:hypothetical protein